MSGGKTPGQAAGPVSVGAQLAAALDERDQARERYADAVIANRELAVELAAARNLVAEILDAADPDRGAENRIAEWRKRAGLEPKFVTAGTDHLALQLLDPNYPDGPAWQAVADMPARER